VRVDASVPCCLLLPGATRTWEPWVVRTFQTAFGRNGVSLLSPLITSRDQLETMIDLFSRRTCRSFYLSGCCKGWTHPVHQPTTTSSAAHFQKLVGRMGYQCSKPLNGPVAKSRGHQRVGAEPTLLMLDDGDVIDSSESS
jgi:hypothetical protein